MRNEQSFLEKDLRLILYFLIILMSDDIVCAPHAGDILIPFDVNTPERVHNEVKQKP